MTANPPRISLPKAWPAHVASAVLRVTTKHLAFDSVFTLFWAESRCHVSIQESLDQHSGRDLRSKSAEISVTQDAGNAVISGV